MIQIVPDMTLSVVCSGDNGVFNADAGVFITGISRGPHMRRHMRSSGNACDVNAVVEGGLQRSCRPRPYMKEASSAKSGDQPHSCT